MQIYWTWGGMCLTLYIWSVQVTKNILKGSGQSILGIL
jgi:hypothetical protein